MKKRLHLGIYLILILSIFFVTAALVNKNTNKWESSEEISFNISGFDGNLSEAIVQDLFRTSISSILDSPAPDGGHSLNEIWVSVNGVEMTFKNAIQQSTDPLCGIASPTTSYSNAPDPSHLGTEIEISAGKSLQDVINNGSLVNIDGNWSDWGACINDQKTRACNNPEPFCGGLDCVGINTQFCGVPLVNGVHTESECNSAGGTVHDAGGGTGICKFPGASCPPDPSEKSDWTQYLSWSSTSRGERIVHLDWFGRRYWSFYTRSHGFSNNDAIESCTNSRCTLGGLNTNCGYNNLGGTHASISCTQPFTLRASRTQIGCY